MKRIFLVVFIFSLNQTFCQDINDENNNKVFVEVFGKCFKDLKPIEGTKEILPLKKDVKFCSLYQCVSRIEYTEGKKDIQEAVLNRAIEITTLLYNEGTPIYLISGMGSFDESSDKNQNLTDDNNCVYISIAECITSNALEKIKDIVNERTTKLINSK